MDREEKEGKAESLLFDSRLKIKGKKWKLGSKSQDLARERKKKTSHCCVLYGET